MIQKNLTTIVAANHLMADTIAKAIGATSQHEGFYHGNGFAVTWTNGCIIEATCNTDESFIMSSNMDMRLMYAHNFSFKMRNYDKLLGYKKSEQDAKQLSTIKALWKKSHTIVNAMYPSAEGELDFLNLYYFIGSPVKVRRAWLPILTKGAIRHGVLHGPTNNMEYEDWLQEELTNVFLSQLDKEMDTLMSLSKEEITEIYTEEEIIEMRNSLQNVIEDLETMTDTESYDDSNVEGGIRFEISEGVHLFSAVTLVMKAEDELGFSMDKTKTIALSLYAKKLISYPLVIQNEIPGGIWKKMCYNKQILRYNSKWGKTVNSRKPSRRHNFRDGECHYNGFGIVTTGLHPTDLNRDEEKLYNLIVKRVLDAFAPLEKGNDKKAK